MIKTTLLTAFTLTATVAFADKASSVVDLPATKAVKIAKKSDVFEGCGLAQLDAALGKGSSETTASYNEKALLAASKMKSKRWPDTTPDIKGVWSWCATPDREVRVWSACLGAGGEMACNLFVAPITKGKLGKATQQTLGSAPPEIERIDSGTPKSGWTGSGLKVRFEAGRGDGHFAVYLHNNAVKTTKVEWTNE